MDVGPTSLDEILEAEARRSRPDPWVGLLVDDRDIRPVTEAERAAALARLRQASRCAEEAVSGLGVELDRLLGDAQVGGGNARVG